MHVHRFPALLSPCSHRMLRSSARRQACQPSPSSSLTLLRHAELIIGNSSAGIREAPYYGVPTINIGSRQDNRAVHNHIVHTDYTTESIKAALDRSLTVPPTTVDDFGQGNSSQLFMELLGRKELWMTDPQKQFIDRHG